MKQIKAFVHRNRVGDIVHALDAAGFTRLSLFDVKGMLRALSAREQEYSVELGEKMRPPLHHGLAFQQRPAARNKADRIAAGVAVDAVE